jgi:hypothetical protein
MAFKAWVLAVPGHKGFLSTWCLSKTAVLSLSLQAWPCLGLLTDESHFRLLFQNWEVSSTLKICSGKLLSFTVNVCGVSQNPAVIFTSALENNIA